MKNLAGHMYATNLASMELLQSGAEVVKCAPQGEVKSQVMGRVGAFTLTRAWVYWVANGYMPLDLAERLDRMPRKSSSERYSGHGEPPIMGDVVRVDGYAQDMRTKNIYAHEDANAAKRAAAWARDHGDDPLLRIVLCGLEGEHNMPGWRCVAWKGHGGYGLQGTGRGRKNRDRERLWLSPGCLDLAPSEQMNLLSSLE